MFIKNFRNFLDTDIRIKEKQVIFGENDVGKTNYIYALQLLFDPSMSEEDRTLSPDDFNNSLVEPCENKMIIKITAYISNFEHSRTILAQLSDATVEEDGKRLLKFTYEYYPEEVDDGIFEYRYRIFKGDDETKLLVPNDRKYLSMRVIRPLRDVEYELRNSKTSPLVRLLRQYSIDESSLKEICVSMQDASRSFLGKDELVDLLERINNRLGSMLGKPDQPSVSFTMSEIEAAKIVSSLRLMFSNRSMEEISLGYKNLVYIALLLNQIAPPVVPKMIDKKTYDLLSKKRGGDIIEDAYNRTEQGNFRLNQNADIGGLTKFVLDQPLQPRPEIILAIEEPEAHLHPSLQRLVFRDLLRNSENAILLTTHSTQITAISPLEFMVHLRKKNDSETVVHTTANLKLEPSDVLDITRYVDVKRGELYFGKSVLIVEGLAEEFILPAFAKVLGLPFDPAGVIVCNIGSTNYLPYANYLSALGIPYAIISDGDFYKQNAEGVREYHVRRSMTEGATTGSLGVDNAMRYLEGRGKSCANKKESEIRRMAKEEGLFIGIYTLEVDIMKASASSEDAIAVIYRTYESLCHGGERQKAFFLRSLQGKEYFTCLSRIEDNGIGKGRFAQVFAEKCKQENIPEYIRDAIRFLHDR